MKATELRIGNLAQGKDGPLKISFIQTEQKDETMIRGWYIESINSAFGASDEYIKPIPLTEEWLIKFGFKKEGKLLLLKINENISLSYCPSNTDMVCDIMNTEDGFDYNYNDVGQLTHFCIIDSQYVHQLQNLFFALTGTELNK